MSSNNKQLTGASALVWMLQAYSVKHIFGLCGDTSLPFYDALHGLDHGMEHILTRDERSAGYMADAYARVTGKVGVCEGPSGGGATHILPGLVEASESSIPILGITTDISTAGREHYARIRFVRWIGMDNRRFTTQNEHRQILQAIRKRDKEVALARISDHIRMRFDQINANLKEGLSRIYWGEAT